MECLFNSIFIQRRIKMNFGRAFTYVSEDTEWFKKLGIAALVILIPVIGSIALLGWGLEITRRVIIDDPLPLPSWSDFGDLLSKGFKAFVVVLAYLFPLCLIYGCGWAATFGLAAVAGGNNSGSSSDALGGVALAVMGCMYCFVILYALIAMLIIPPALGNLAATGELGAAFRFGEVFGLLRAAIGPYLLSLLILAVASSVLSSIGSAICGVGVLLTTAYLTAISGHLHGQAYKVAKGGQNAAPLASTM
jgi:hypothetical protein